ncbi:MAG: rRNA pseudouridine synthase, partial [Chloroflexota bacterium]|nr:rRNA pseudouridine synthase [Chloroflexota bacterium]
MVDSEGERLQKVLAHAGVASRRAAEALIQAGRVAVDGVVVTELGTRVNAARQAITVDGQPLGTTGPIQVGERVTYLLNKPAGVLSTSDDPQRRPTVVTLVPSTPRVYPVGRLDADSEGLLLLSNDGDLTYRLTHPRYGVDKEYEALVRGYVTQETLRRLSAGVVLDDSPRPTAPAVVEQIARVGEDTLLRFVIHEGRNRQIRRMMQAVGGGVLSLRRVRFGPLALGGLAAGHWRLLTAAEVAALDAATGTEATAFPAPLLKGEGSLPAAAPSVVRRQGARSPAPATSARQAAKAASRPPAGSGRGPSGPG